MPDQPDIQKHLNAEVTRLVMELATAKAVIEVLERQVVRQTEASPPEQSGREGGARGADGPHTE